MIPQLILLLRVTGLIFEERQQSARITVSSINDYNISNHKHNFQPNYKLFLFLIDPIMWFVWDCVPFFCNYQGLMKVELSTRLTKREQILKDKGKTYVVRLRDALELLFRSIICPSRDALLYSKDQCLYWPTPRTEMQNPRLVLCPRFPRVQYSLALAVGTSVSMCETNMLDSRNNNFAPFFTVS